MGRPACCNVACAKVSGLAQLGRQLLICSCSAAAAAGCGNHLHRPITRAYIERAFATTAGMAKVQKSDAEWRAVLTPEQYRVLRNQGTEAPGTGEYNKHYEEGTYVCAGCGTPVYKSETKFDSGCGWPAFYQDIQGAVDRHVDTTNGMRRIEITCSSCGGHLGHVFEGEGFPTPTDQRHCVNSASLKFQAKSGKM